MIPDLRIIIAAGPHPKAKKDIRQELRRYLIKYCMEPIPKEYRKDFNFDIRLFSDEELDNYILNSDVLIYPYLPQKMISASGNLMRSLGFHKPVVISRNYRLQGLWGADVDLDVGAFADRIYQLLTDKEERHKQVMNQGAIVSDNSWENIAQMHLALYSRL